MDYDLLNTPGVDSDYIPPTTTPSVPPDYLIQSGGGLSNMHHGHPQGPYSETASRSDIYGYSEPFQQTGFMQAVRGSMYDGTGLEKMVPRTCSNLGMNQMAPYATHPPANISYPHGQQIVYGPKKNDANVENFGGNEEFELIEPFTDDTLESIAGVPSNNTSKKHPVIILILFFFIFLALDLWIQSSNSLIKRYVFRSERPSIKQLLIASAVASCILVLVALWLGVPLVRFESP